MKLIINGVSVSVNKQLVKEIVFNGSEVTVINETKNFVNDEIPIINEISKQDVCVSEYTVDNPKLVDYYLDFKDKEMFTGVVKDEEGTIAHYVDGKFHRDNGAAIEWSNGRKEWLFHGVFHRTNGPAVECDNGNKLWFINGKRHRKDGPAVEFADGHKEWWFDGEWNGIDGNFTNESWAAHLATLE